MKKKRELQCVGKCKDERGKVTAYIVKTNRYSLKVLNTDQIKDILKQGYFSIDTLKLDPYERITNRIAMNTI